MQISLENIHQQEDPYQLLNAVRPDIDQKTLASIDNSSLTGYDRIRLIKKLEREMKNQAEQMNFEFAIALRDKVRQLKEEQA